MNVKYANVNFSRTKRRRKNVISNGGRWKNEKNPLSLQNEFGFLRRWFDRIVPCVSLLLLLRLSARRRREKFVVCGVRPCAVGTKTRYSNRVGVDGI